MRHRCAAAIRPRHPERVARALERSAAEPLALDQAPERRDTVLELLGQQQEQLERQREAALANSPLLEAS